MKTMKPGVKYDYNRVEPFGFRNAQTCIQIQYDCKNNVLTGHASCRLEPLRPAIIQTVVVFRNSQESNQTNITKKYGIHS